MYHGQACIAGKKKTKNFLKFVFYACFICALYGVLTEILQGIFVWLGRAFEIDDMIADLAGCAVVYGWFYFRHKKE